ncbi:MAG: hypothetical protein K9G59_17225 [Caulobacter sp.]|nr:hypothetical protein [Caulobacter sp.]
MASRVCVGLIAAGLWAVAGSASAVESAPGAVTTVDGVTVVADMDVRLMVAIGGDVPDGTYVSSAPSGLFCGGVQTRFATQFNYQCWLRIKRKAPVVLAAQSNGHYGVDWTVQWVGCEPVANGAACKLAASEEAQVVALFTRK